MCQREYIKFNKHLFIYSIIYVRYRAWVPTGTTVPGMVPGTSTTGTMVLKQFYNKLSNYLFIYMTISHLRVYYLRLSVASALEHMT